MTQVILDEAHEELIPVDSKTFQWIDRIGCVEALALECADNGNKFDIALRSIRLRDYSIHTTKMTVKQKTALKRDVTRKVKDIIKMRESADVGDVVRVPKMIPNPLLGGYKRDGLKLVDAIVTEKQLLSSAVRYKVKRLTDGEVQIGNGHMIKSIVRRAAAGGDGG
ncbi:hypothetical protein [Paenibacillus sp. MSJ-34]|uniref:hypothetical protein n=1 Tax=Paenibacillus sp. MSJ-34 TaxID=2841529 RepID=UPI001C0F76F5|nr:hypothetical protein [Paenibacillus sp. MSJ-34]MBU5442059.1 hypothetical protein [Paenibacillus sp. MSJ-34]